MKKFSRCALILIIVTIISAIAGYIFENSTITPMYTSTAKLVVTPGADNEASLRAKNGALKMILQLYLRVMLLFQQHRKL